MIRNKLICFLPFFINESGHEISFINIFKKIGKKSNKNIILVVKKKFFKIKEVNLLKFLNYFHFINFQIY